MIRLRSDDFYDLQMRVPVAYETDILVVGGGPAGTVAAFAAAEMGRRVMLVEQFNCLGGVATAGGHGPARIRIPADQPGRTESTIHDLWQILTCHTRNDESSPAGHWLEARRSARNSQQYEP